MQLDVHMKGNMAGRMAYFNGDYPTALYDYEQELLESMK